MKSIEIPKPATTTTCATFRLPKEKLNQLRKVSQTKSVTPNTLVNQIINEYLDWHRRAARANCSYLPKSFLIRLLNELAEKELNELARDVAKNDLVDISLFLRGGFNLD